MTEKDFKIHDIAVLLTSNKSKKWQSDIISGYSSLFHFMISQKLFIGVEPFDEKGNLKLDLIVKKSNITDEGLQMYKKIIPGWFSYLDKSTVPNKYENISRLEKGLAKIREAKK